MSTTASVSSHNSNSHSNYSHSNNEYNDSSGRSVNSRAESVESGTSGLGSSNSPLSRRTSMTSSGGNGDGNGNPKARNLRFGNSRQSKGVIRMRRFIAVLLLLFAGLVSWGVYSVMALLETNSFQSQFAEDATKIFHSYATSLDLTLGAMDFMALNMASYARSSGQEWPFVTIPDFAVRAEKTRALTNAVYLNLYNYVESDQRYEWEAYSAEHGPEWIKEGMAVQKRQQIFQDQMAENEIYSVEDVVFFDVIHDYDECEKPEDERGSIGLDPSDPGPFLPMWQQSPIIPVMGPYNWDLLSDSTNSSMLHIMDTQKVLLTETYLIAFEDDLEGIACNEYEAEWLEAYLPTEEETNEPIVDLYYPIIGDSPDWVTLPDDLQRTGNGIDNEVYDPVENKLGALLSATIYWRDWFQDILPEGNNGVVIVQSSPCNPSFTYEINGPNTRYMGVGDKHDPKYDSMGRSASLLDLDRWDPRSKLYTGIPLSHDYCSFVLSIYPSSTFEASFRSNDPLIYTLVTGGVFLVAAVSFMVYVYLVEKRRKQLVKSANRTDAIVSNMLPTGIRERLYEEAEAADMAGGSTTGTDDGGYSNRMGGPIAQLYPSATVIFIDVAGFTAWSSTREPDQVFQLLETIYRRWDKLAYRYGVFKIETVGDCYVAVAGLPDPCDKHTIAVARFARDVMSEWPALTRKMEVSLGPDTTKLGLRIGFNSGQVTAGVLRGTMTRYQLFGDTVNTASRLQTTSERGRIQISSCSAELIQKHGKGYWLKKNAKLVPMKGKGDTETYWLQPRKPSKNNKSSRNAKPRKPSKNKNSSRNAKNNNELSQTQNGNPDSNNMALPPITEQDCLDDRSTVSSSGSSSGTCRDSTNSGDLGLDDIDEFDKTSRLVEWNSLVLSELLQHIVSSRDEDTSPEWSSLERTELQILESDGTVLEEFQEIIQLPPANAASKTKSSSVRSSSTKPRRGSRLSAMHQQPAMQLTKVVRDQLLSYITDVASMYRDNHFHNFEHATHVTSSVRKLLTRIVHVDETELVKTNDSVDSDMTLTELLTGHSYGITSDPLTQFTVVLSAIIHDCDHPGVPNITLIEENAPSAKFYKQKSIAEQNSVDLCWKILMEPRFKELRGCIYHTQDELLRFRQLLVNVVMATDIVDKELGALRKARWAVAFSEEPVLDANLEYSPELDKNRKATIVLEHLIQASDVCHTMQHWDVYKEWNEKFFFELYSTYKNGRASKNIDPSIGWYKGEIGFFDFYVIPIAKKLDKCGVFGVSSHEYLDYARANRDEWVRRGEDCVRDYLEEYRQQYPEEEEVVSKDDTTVTVAASCSLGDNIV